MISPRSDVRTEPAPTRLLEPYGGRLVDLLVPDDEREEVKRHASELPSIQLSDRSVSDLELLATGALSPLDRFMSSADYDAVLSEMRLADGRLFGIPVTLPVHRRSLADRAREVALRDAKNDLLAVMTIDEVYSWERGREADAVYGTRDVRHPIVAEMHRWGELYVSGVLRVLQLPRHYDFQELRLTPAETRARLASLGRSNVVAHIASGPLTATAERATKRAMEDARAALLIHASAGVAGARDVAHFATIRAHRALAARAFSGHPVLLSLLPLATRFGGPREAIWNAVVERNHGANALLVGREHAGDGLDSTGRPFYRPGEAGRLLERHASELGVRAVPVNGSLERRGTGRTRREVAEILAEAHPPRHRQGVCVWFTGLSGAGKSTTAEVLTTLLLERGRQVTLLDGDVVRTELSQGLGFSRADRDTNVRRIGFVASEIVKHGGTVVCAVVSPYRAARNDVRAMIGEDRFLEVFVDTPLEVCERRDAKGMYAKARRGELHGFTGIDDPYEPPEAPDVTLDTVSHTPRDNALRIVQCLAGRGFIRP